MGFQFILILDLLGMYFDAAVVFVTKFSLLFRLAVAIICVSQFFFESISKNVNDLQSELLMARTGNFRDLYDYRNLGPKLFKKAALKVK